MSETNMERGKIEAFLAAPQFIRSYEVMATYQRLLQESKDDPSRQELIKKRLRDRFEPHDFSEGDEKEKKTYEELRRVRHQMFYWSEKGELTKEKMAGLLAGCSLSDTFLERYNPKPGNRTDTGNIMVNDTLAYAGGKEGDDYISISIVPAATQGWAELQKKVVDGFQKLAQELKNGKMHEVKSIGMTSWLLGPAFEDKFQAIFGKDIKITNVDEDDEGADQVQNLALSYNKRSAEEYLSTGKLPPVRTLTMTKEEFINKFA